MKQVLTLTALAGITLPRITEAVTYSADGAAILEAETEPVSENILAAAGMSNFDLTCLLLFALMIASLYLFHAIWHPKREHEAVNERTRRDGSMRFYLGGTIVWMLISVMAQAWCVIIPLAVVFTGVLIHYALHKAQLV